MSIRGSGAKRPEEDEVKWLMAREIPRLRRYAQALANDAAAADDLVQDCLEKAMRKQHQLKRHGGLRVWLYRILYTVFVDQQRRSTRSRKDVSIDDLSDPPSEDARQDRQVVCQEVAEAMRRLPVEQRAAITLVAVEGLSYDEAASVLDVPLGTVRSRLARGRDALRRLYSDPETRSPLRLVK